METMCFLGGSEDPSSTKFYNSSTSLASEFVRLDERAKSLNIGTEYADARRQIRYTLMEPVFSHFTTQHQARMMCEFLGLEVPFLPSPELLLGLNAHVATSVKYKKHSSYLAGITPTAQDPPAKTAQDTLLQSLIDVIKTNLRPPRQALRRHQDLKDRPGHLRNNPYKNRARSTCPHCGKRDVQHLPEECRAKCSKTPCAYGRPQCA